MKYAKQNKLTNLNGESEGQSLCKWLFVQDFVQLPFWVIDFLC